MTSFGIWIGLYSRSSENLEGYSEMLLVLQTVFEVVVDSVVEVVG